MTGRRRRRALAVLFLPLLASCGSPAETQEQVTVLQIQTPVRAPVWSQDTGQLLALAQDAARIVAVDPAAGGSSAARVRSSPELPDAGANLALSPTTRRVAYLPQPALGRIAVVDLATLRPVGTLRAGPAPEELAVDVGSEILYSLAEDGSTVTGVAVEGDPRTLPPVGVQVGADVMLEGPERGRSAEFFVAGSGGVALYEGSPRAEQVDSIDVPATAAVGDVIQVTRLYVAEAGSDRLLAVGFDGERLTTVAQTSLGAPAEFLGVDNARIYAATRDQLIVLAANPFTGFEDDTFEVLARIDFRASLPPALAQAPLSGLAVEPETDRVYLTLEDQPYLLSIGKPDV